MKLAKRIYRSISRWCRRYGITQKERALSERDKAFVRAKRNNKNLPNSWDTQWIKRPANWKHRSKNPSQYYQREYSEFELNQFYSNADTKEEFMFTLSQMKKRDPNEWRYFSKKERESNYIKRNSLYEIAFDLYMAGLIVGECIHDDNSRPCLVLIRCKLP